MYNQQVVVLFRYGCKLSHQRDLVKDCIQDLFYHLWERREGLGDTNNIRLYLFAALRRSIIARLKSAPVQSQFPIDQFATPSPETEWIDEQTTEDQLATLAKSMQILPNRQREALFLKYYQNLSTEEIAITMSINRRAVYKLLAKAIANLRHSWSKMGRTSTMIVNGSFLLSLFF